MPLSGLMRPGQPMPPQQAAPIMFGVLTALALAHQRGIVHRDLKPDNLFLVPDGTGNHVVKVLDFGIAKVMDAAGGMGSKTKTGILLGTPGYMSPEQIKNSKGVDARSDLWSVGIILYEMLTGREAFPADNEFTRLTLVLTQEITPIAQLNPQLAAWAGFFQRALSKDLNGRFQHAGEMSQALMAMVQSNKSVSAQGREWGTVVLSIPQPPPGHMPGSAVQQGRPGSYPGHSDSGGYPPQTAQRPGSQQPPPQQSQQQLPQPQIHSIHGTSAMQMQPQQMQGRPPSMPPPGVQSGPATHVSGMRPPGTPSHVGGPSPEVPVVRAPPVGFPLWVLIAVGVAGIVVGFVIGAAAF
jgi:serine/threonine protein kinase